MSRTGDAARDAGFTLVELLVVLAIVAVLGALAMPAFHRFAPGVRLDGSAREVASVLREARSRAIRDNDEAEVVVDPGRGTVAGAGRTVELDRDLGVSVRAAAREVAGTESAAIRFFPDGTSTGGEIGLMRGEREVHVVVDWLTGRIALDR